MKYGRSFKLRLLLLSAAVLVVDQWTKSLVETHLSTGPPQVIIPGFLDLIYVRNSGIAFGLFAAGSNTAGVMILTLLGVVALGLVLLYFWKTPAANSPPPVAPPAWAARAIPLAGSMSRSTVSAPPTATSPAEWATKRQVSTWPPP